MRNSRELAPLGHGAASLRARNAKRRPFVQLSGVSMLELVAMRETYSFMHS